MKISAYAALALAHFSLTGWAAGFENSSSNDLSERHIWYERRQQAFIGKTFYGYFNRQSCRYPYDPAIQSAPTAVDRNRYVAESPKSFVVEGLTRSQTLGHENVIRYFRVKTEDGFVGFIETSKFRLGDPEKEESLKNDCFWALEPQEVQAKLDIFALARTAKVEAEFASRRKWEEFSVKLEAERKAQEEIERVKLEARTRLPGARIGMTAKQVIEKTSWGEPRIVNRTVTQYGVEEQWVYGSRNYLYFRNGRLKAIQN